MPEKVSNSKRSFEAVELRPAYSWDCSECGGGNFSRAIVPEMSEDELEELRTEHGIEVWEDGAFMMMPTEVECLHCHQIFPTLHFSEG